VLAVVPLLPSTACICADIPAPAAAPAAAAGPESPGEEGACRWGANPCTGMCWAVLLLLCTGSGPVLLLLCLSLLPPPPGTICNGPLDADHPAAAAVLEGAFCCCIEPLALLPPVLLPTWPLPSALCD
jgi:hypothetical protein